jgi:hypothetical protein
VSAAQTGKKRGVIVKLKILLGGFVIAALGASVALASRPPSNPGLGHTTTSGSTTTTTTQATTTTAQSQKPACVPQVAVIVRGTASADVGSSSTVSLTVTGGNHFAKLLFANTALSVNTTSKTQVTTASGKASPLSAIDKGERVLAMYKVCRSSITGKSPNLTSPSTLSSFLASLSPTRVVELGNAKGQA